MKATCNGLYNFSGEAHLFSIGSWNTEVKTNVSAIPHTHAGPSCRTAIRRPIIEYVINQSELTVHPQVSPAMADQLPKWPIHDFEIKMIMGASGFGMPLGLARK
jgi:hypothetical protein